MKSFLRAALAALVLVPSFLYAQAAPTGSFTLATRVNANGTLTPTLTWTTTPAATSCVASGDSAWAGNKAASGTQALADFPTTTPKAYALVCTWPGQTQAMLTWTPPTQNTDGTPLTNLAGYRVNYGASAQQLVQAAQLANPTATGHTISNLTPGTWYFGVKAYTTQGAESALSNIVSKAVTGPVEWNQSTGVKVPQAPVLE
jgi:fibronectin type III domain protein